MRAGVSERAQHIFAVIFILLLLLPLLSSQMSARRREMGRGEMKSVTSFIDCFRMTAPSAIAAVDNMTIPFPNRVGNV